MKRLSPEHIREIMLGSGSLAILMLLSAGSFSKITLEGMRKRSKKRNGLVTSEKTGKRSLGLPLDGAHYNHYEGQHHPHYNDLDNGQLLTIYEHLQQHQQARLLPNQDSLAPEKQMLDNGLSVEGNQRAIEFMQISVFVFEAIVFQHERDIDALLDRYEEQGAQSATITLDKIEEMVDETMERYDHFRDLSPQKREQLAMTIQAHRREINFELEAEPAREPVLVR
jgi:hypothetical protein